MIRVVAADGQDVEIDVIACIERMRRLPALRALDAGRMVRIGEVVVRRSPKAGASGHAWYEDRRLTFTFGLVEQERAEELVLHEVAHLAINPNGPPWHNHDGAFRLALLAAAREVWPSTRRVRNAGKVYSLDATIWQTAAMEAAAQRQNGGLPSAVKSQREVLDGSQGC